MSRNSIPDIDGETVRKIQTSSKKFKTIELYGIYKCQSRVEERFVSSLLTIHQSVCVELEKTNIDDVTAKRIPICHVENTENRCNIVDPDVTCHSLLYIHSIHSNEFNNASNFMY